MSRCYSRKPLGYPSGLPDVPRETTGKREEGREEGEWVTGEDCSFSLERKFAQLSGTRCLPLVPLIVLESTTGAESKNKGNTSRAVRHHRYSFPASFALGASEGRWNRSLHEVAIYFPSLVSIGSALKDVHLLHYLTGEGLRRADISPLPCHYKWSATSVSARAQLYLIDRRFARPSRGILIVGNRGEVSGG